MALPAVMRKFEVQLADSDRELYETIELRVAQHPSESERYLVARVLARVLEHSEGLEFSKGGVSDDVEPALVVRNLRNELIAWIEVGAPSPDRLHKATKLCKRVVIYAWKDPEKQAAAIVEREVHRASEIELFGLDPAVLDGVAATLDRINKWDLAITGGSIYLTIGERLFETAAPRIAIE
ncbi:MAG: YaeQ family protein [Kofleriaceae bacterium]